ncbi:hypothetical protein G6539_24230, partial [Streptomyces albidoflavus]|nr:hypothetical protein [Streptomyces albidoflavus]
SAAVAAAALETASAKDKALYEARSRPRSSSPPTSCPGVRQARALAGAYLAVRSPEDAAGVARSDPDRLVPLLLDAARGVSEERHWDLVHAFRVAGVLA